MSPINVSILCFTLLAKRCVCQCPVKNYCTVLYRLKSVEPTERAVSRVCTCLTAVGRRLQRVDADDLLEPVDLDEHKGVLEDGRGRHAAEQQVGGARRRRRAAVVVEVRQTPVVVRVAFDRHLRLARRLDVVPEHASSDTRAHTRTHAHTPLRPFTRRSFTPHPARRGMARYRTAPRVAAFTPNLAPYGTAPRRTAPDPRREGTEPQVFITHAGRSRGVDAVIRCVSDCLCVSVHTVL